MENVCLFDYSIIASSGTVGARSLVKHAYLLPSIIATACLKSDRNSCVLVLCEAITIKSLCFVIWGLFVIPLRKVSFLLSFCCRLLYRIDHTRHQVKQVSNIKRDFYQDFKSDLNNNMNHMRISGTEPSSVILRQTKCFKKLKIDAPKVPKQTET